MALTIPPELLDQAELVVVVDRDGQAQCASRLSSEHIVSMLRSVARSIEHENGGKSCNCAHH